jgi:bisphosphoglycerate-independent phosphoglycerate mutase (AlkP superfamily)
VDMVAHTGNESATLEAVQHVDVALALIVATAKDQGIHLIITADHGNGERLQTADGTPDTAHTTNPVPCIVIPAGYTPNDKARVQESLDALHSLGDVAGFIKTLYPLSVTSLP